MVSSFARFDSKDLVPAARDIVMGEVGHGFPLRADICGYVGHFSPCQPSLTAGTMGLANADKPIHVQALCRKQSAWTPTPENIMEQIERHSFFSVVGDRQ
jgi:hypothetical protein